MADLFDGARVLITGGTGSLGQTLVRRLLRGYLGVPAKLIVFSRDEAKQHTVAGASEDHVDAASAGDPRRRRARWSRIRSPYAQDRHVADRVMTYLLNGLGARATPRRGQPAGA